MSQQKILEALAAGYVLKSHREMSGKKEFIIRYPDGQTEVVNPKLVKRLREMQLIDSNKKFPVSTFWLTDRGHEITKRQVG
jgi:hypothetical protein